MKNIFKKIPFLHPFYLFSLSHFRNLKNKLIIPEYSMKRQVIIEVSKKYNYSNVFVETGTFLGDTVEALKNHFKKIISIELSAELALKAQERFRNNDKIQILNGDSSIMLGDIIESITHPIVFWLDGHYSSEFWSGDQFIKTAKGSKVSPILEELNHIINHPNKKHIILIDDARLFNGEDYPHLREIKKFVIHNMPNYTLKVKKDIIHITPK